MIDLKSFRRANKLTQAQVAEYLEVSAPFISQIEKGKDKLPDEHLNKLLNNKNGWDVTALQFKAPVIVHLESDVPTRASIEPLSIAALEMQVQMLREQLAMAQQQNADYWQLIQKLTERT